jgi:ADP-ribose pyrophosphatase
MPEPRHTKTVYEGGWVRVDVEEWPGVGSYEVVRRRDAAGVLAVTPEGDVLLVRQFRPPVRQHLTEIPAGLLDVDGEDALACASRELFEETGFRHESIEFLGGFYSSAGFSDEYVHLFRARTAGSAEGEPEAGIELVKIPLDRMVAAARRGKVRDAKTAIALLLAPQGLSVDKSSMEIGGA